MRVNGYQVVRLLSTLIDRMDPVTMNSHQPQDEDGRLLESGDRLAIGWEAKPQLWSLRARYCRMIYGFSMSIVVIQKHYL